MSSELVMKVTTRYQKATITGQGQILVQTTGFKKSVPFDYSADDPHRAAIVSALRLTEASESTLVEDAQSRGKYNWRVTL